MGVSQQKLADRLGVTRTTVVRWETERVEMPEMAARFVRMLAAEPMLRKGK